MPLKILFLGALWRSASKDIFLFYKNLLVTIISKQASPPTYLLTAVPNLIPNAMPSSRPSLSRPKSRRALGLAGGPEPGRAS